MTWIDALALVLIVISIAVLVASSIVHRRPKKMLAELIIEGIARNLYVDNYGQTDFVVTNVVTSTDFEVGGRFQVNVTLEPRAQIQQRMDEQSILHGMMAYGAKIKEEIVDE